MLRQGQAIVSDKYTVSEVHRTCHVWIHGEDMHGTRRSGMHRDSARDQVPAQMPRCARKLHGAQEENAADWYMA